MVGLGDVRRWKPGTLDHVFQQVRQRQAVLTSSGDDFFRTMPVAGWQGAAADSAAAGHGSLISQLDHLAAGTSIVNKTIAQAADAIPAVQRAITEADELARRYGYQVSDAGQIIDVLHNPGPADPNPADRARVKQQLVDDIEQVLRTADDIDNDLAAVLKQASAGKFGTGAETTVQGAAADALQESPGETLTTPRPTARRPKTPPGGPRCRRPGNGCCCMTTRTGWATWTACPPRPARPRTSPACRASELSCSVNWTS